MELTELEEAIAILIAQGKNNAKIAGLLQLTRPQVGNAVNRILKKLGKHYRTEIAIWLFQNRPDLFR